jgi:type I restriction enzyme S subunit
VPLSTLLEFQNGVNAERGAYGAGVPFINVLEVIQNRCLAADRVPGRVTLDPSTERRFAVRKGDILFNRTSETLDEVGLAATYTSAKPMVFGGFVIRGRPVSTVDSEYLALALRSSAVRRQIIARGQGAIHANIGQRDLGSVVVPLPSGEEQRAIALAVLDGEGQVAQGRAVLDKKLALRTATLQALVIGRTRLDGFEEPWRRMLIGDVLKVRHGRSQRDVEVDGGPYPILGTSGEIGRAAMPLYTKPSVLIGRKGTINRPQYADAPFWSIDTLFYTEVREAAIPKYLYFLFTTIDWMAYNETSGRPSLNATTIENIEISLPSIQEQRAIVEILTDMDAEIEAARATLKKSEVVAEGMAQALASGSSRLA